MKKIFFKLIFILALVSAGFLTSCEDEGTAEQTTLTITSIEPLTAREGDTITINGTGFASDRTQNTVAFASASGRVGSGEQGLVASATETQLKVVIPDYAYSGALYVSYREQSVTSSQEFILDESLRAPVITAISPANGYVGSQVTITGDNFGTDASLVKVLFGETETAALSVTMTTITTKVPKGLAVGEVSVSVKREEEVSGSTVTFVVDKASVNVTSYWTSVDEYTISRGEITEDGVNIKVLYDAEDGVEGPVGIALDATNGMLYWCNQYTRSIMKAPADGSGPVETIFDANDGVSYPSDIAFNSADNSVYYTDYIGTNEQYIRKGDLTSGTLTNIYTITEADAFPYALKLIMASNKIYWVEMMSAKVYEGSLDGTATPKLLFDSSDGLTSPASLAIDNTNNTIYIVDNRDNGVTAAIYKGKLDGSGSLTKIVGAGDDLNNAQDLEIDPENGYIYWINYNSLNEGGYIKRATLDGSTIETQFMGIYGGLFFDLYIH